MTVKSGLPLRIIGFGLLMLGLVMFSGVLGLVTVNIDTTPPLIYETDYYGHCPENGASYTSLTYIFCWVYEAQSTVTSVVCTIDGVNYPLTLAVTSGYKYKYAYTGSNTAYGSEGSHSYTFKATNDHGLSSTRSGSYSIQANLDGSWYLNDIQIVSTDQQIKLTTNTLKFEFVVTQGTVNVCYVDYSGSASGRVTLTKESTTRWSNTGTFSNGVYSMVFVASDASGNDIRFSIFALEIGDVDLNGNGTPNGDGIPNGDMVEGLSFIQQLGLGVTALGILFMVIRKPKK